MALSRKIVRDVVQRLALLLVSKACTNKFYISGQYISYNYRIHTVIYVHSAVPFTVENYLRNPRVLVVRVANLLVFFCGI